MKLKLFPCCNSEILNIIKLCVLLFLPTNLLGQPPIASFSVESPSCNNENLSITNSSLNSDSYEWHFCKSDMQGALINFGKLVNPSMKVAQGFDLVSSNNKWFGFVANRGGNNILILEYSSDLNKDPIIRDLGNINNRLNGPSNIRVFNDGVSWYAIVLNFNSNRVSRIDFGDDLTNTPVAMDLGSFGTLNNPIGLDIVHDGTGIKTIITNNADQIITILNFGSSLASVPISSSFELEEGVKMNSIALGNSEEKWFGIVSSKGNNKLFHISFNTIISTNVILEEIAIGGLILNEPAGVDIVSYMGDFYAFVQSIEGNVYRFDFGSDLSNWSNGTDLGQIFEQGNFTMNIVRFGNKEYGFSLSFKNHLDSFEFDVLCNSTISSSTKKNPIVSFSEAGSYDISLISRNNSGKNDWLTQQVLITTNAAPDLDFINENFCLLNLTIFTSSSDQTLTSYEWDFGDGLPTSSVPNPSHQYASIGTYNVRLTVESENGCGQYIEREISIYNSPIASYTIPSGLICANNWISFTNTSTFDPGSPTTWLWNFGDGSPTSTDQGVNHIFKSGGTYTVTLTAEMPSCTDVFTTDIIIEEAPATIFSFNNTCNTQTTTFTDETTGSNLIAWNWDFGDGNNSTVQSPTHIYATAGKYVVTLSVSNNLGCTTTKVDTVYNHDIPVANFSNDLACSTSPIQFTDQSLVANANLVAWEWNFGDGNTSNDQNPQYLYNQTGDFTVKLKAYSQFGCVDSTETIISVAQGPQVDFEWDKACQGETTTFTDLTNSFGVPITNWNWIVDGTLLTSQNPTYTFSSSGTFTVQLSVTVNNLCAQTYPQEITVKIPPTVQFDYTEGCGGIGTTFYDLTDQTDDPIISRIWRVDGFPISTDTAATVQLNPGTYSVNLSVITSAGCEETTTSNVSLIGSPVSAFEVNTIYGAAPLQVDFSNSSTGGSTYDWGFGDANDASSTEKNPTFTYSEIGIYTVILRTSSDPSCYDETTQEIEVVSPESSAEIIALTPITTNSITNFVVTIENSGTNIIDNSASLVFRADYGTEVIELVNTIIYAGKTVNYSASYAIASNSNASAICVELLDSQKTQLDRSCININSSIHISEPYPNPTQGLITIDVTLENSSSINIRMLNRSGQPVLQKIFEGQTGLSNILLDGQGLPQGLYIIEVTVGSKTEQFKTSIVR